MPPIPASRPPSLQPLRAPELLRQVRPQRLELLALGLVAGQEALGHAHRAERPRAHVQRLAPPHLAELQRAAAEVERHAVVERRRVDRRQVAVARLVLGREHLDLEPRALARRRQEVLLVGRVADRRGGDRAHVVDPGGAAEVGEQLDRLQRALHRLRLQLARRVEPRAHAHRLVDLVGPAPPAVAAVLAPREHDQAERVRPEVDHRQAPVAHDANASRRCGAAVGCRPSERGRWCDRDAFCGCRVDGAGSGSACRTRHVGGRPQRGGREVRPFFDSRAGAAAAPARSAAGRAALRSRLGRSGVLEVDPLTNTPRVAAQAQGRPDRRRRAAAATRSRARYLRAQRVARSASRRADVDALTLAKRANAPRRPDAAALPPGVQGHPDLRQRRPRGARPRGPRARRHRLAPARAGRRLRHAEAVRAAAMRALQRSVGIARAACASKAARAGARRTTRLRERRAGAADAVRRRRRPAAGVARRLQGEHRASTTTASSTRPRGRLLWRANRVKSFTGNVFDYYLGAPDGGTLRSQDLTTPGWLPATARPT